MELFEYALVSDCSNSGPIETYYYLRQGVHSLFRRLLIVLYLVKKAVLGHDDLALKTLRKCRLPHERVRFTLGWNVGLIASSSSKSRERVQYTL